MLLVALTFVYIFALSAQTGIAVNRWLSIKNPDPFITVFSGLFGITTFACLWAFFGRIGWEFQLALVLYSIILAFIYKSESAAFYHGLRSGIRDLPLSLKIIFGITSALIIAKCAGSPFLPDNESYYIQTVKWLNEYGLVRGLANLHFFFGQTSGWHIAQSVFSLSFIDDRFNDLSGFALWIGNGFAIFRLKDYLKSGSFTALVFGLTGCVNVLLFQFIAAPSPDLPVYIIAFMASWLFVEHFDKASASVLRQITVLVLFGVFIKLTAVALLLLPLLLLPKVKAFSIRTELPLLATCFVTLSLFIAKNLIVSGYAFYPMPMLSFGFEHQVPKIIMDYFAANTRPAAFDIDVTTYQSVSQLHLFKRWLMLPGLHGIFNMLSVLVLLVPVPILFAKKIRSWWLLYFTMVFQWLLLYAISPQYRFGLHFVLIFGLFVLASMIQSRKKLAVAFTGFSIVVASVPLLVPIGMASLSNNKLFRENPVMTRRQAVFPHPNSSETTHFTAETIGNLNYFSPSEPTFFWFTGNGPLPCVNTEQLDFFEKNFGYRPQLGGTSLHDGFHPEKVSD
ncbi:LIC_10190 family membrane protein [Flavobacterium silvaticum]|uniref:DUF8201 domain-containing protein n=1 Tax=Flavobacterium silvaticum TaxID=1852020 RepID=A0A972FJI1_9FLAO|nr:hypothetical protein [Flavobacterium silvaticum]NMH26822.1 hypothetical protein [Flavobacterium silvaticum]